VTDRTDRTDRTVSQPTDGAGAVSEPIRSVPTGERPPAWVGRKLNVLGYFASAIVGVPLVFGLLFVYGFFNHDALISGMAEGFKQRCVDGSGRLGLQGTDAGLKRYCECAWDDVRPRITRLDTALAQVSFGTVDPAPAQRRIDACAPMINQQ
jgi:hypothetical protein